MDQVAQIREKIDLVSLISEYLPLKKLGRNFKINCPFHNEKSPSFVVSPERQIWHCFGCQKGGDCFSFLMEYENLEFPEALRILAKKAGIELEEHGFDKGVTSKKEKIYSLNRQALEFYHYLLINHNVAKKALAYLTEERKIKAPTINTFMLGFAPAIGNALVNYLVNKKKHKKEDLIDAGIAVYKNGRLMDFFSNRLMFPLFDHRDNVVGFSGRILEDSSAMQSSKYVNTRETLVYHKGSTFFGLNISKNKIKSENCAIIVEGEFDVISSFEEGITNIVAVKGTALTEEQVNLIARFAGKVSLCFDQDQAGQEAIRRSVPVLEKKGLTTTVIIPSGKDPDESIKKDPVSFKKAVKNDIGVYDFLLSKAFALFDKGKVEGKKRIGDELLPFFAAIENEIVKEHYFKKLAEGLDTSFESVMKQAGRIQKKESSIIVKRAEKEKRPREEVMEEYLLALIVQSASLPSYAAIIEEILVKFTFKATAYKKILEQLLAHFKTSKTIDTTKFLSTLPKELTGAYDICSLLPLPQFSDDKKHEEEIGKVVAELEFLHLKEKIKEVNEKIKVKEKENLEGQDEELKCLHEELSRLILSLSEKSSVS